MNLTEILAKMESALAGSPRTVDMTAAQFLDHVRSEMAKAAKEPHDIAKQRLDVLRRNVATLVGKAASWESTGGAMPVEMFMDPDQVETTEQSMPAGDVVQTVASVASNESQVLGKAEAAVASALAALEAATSNAQVAAPVVEQAAQVEIAWPKDLTQTLAAESVAKRADDDSWGGDPWTATVR
jgi:hypothetical protein